MFFLSDFVKEQDSIFGDSMDKRPSQMFKPNPLMLVIDETLPLDKKVLALIKSELTAQVCWAISQIPKLGTKYSNTEKLIGMIPSYFISQSSKIELAAVNAAKEILSKHPQQYTCLFLKPILARITAVPAVEYALCIKLMLEIMPAADINNTFKPLISTLFSKSDKFQHVAALILSYIPISKFPITKDEFSVYLKSTVFVNEHLTNVAQLYTSVFGMDWIRKEIPSQLQEILEKKSEIKPGFTTFFLEHMDRILLPSLYSTLLKIIDWGSEDPNIGFLILKRTLAISQSRFVDLAPKVYLITPTLASSSDKKIRAKVPELLVSVPQILNGHESTIQRILTSLQNDKEPDVRKALLDNLENIHSLLESKKLKDMCLNIFLFLFKDQNNDVRESLVNQYLIIELSKSSSPTIMMSVVNLLDSFKTRWRYISRILKAIEQCPKQNVSVVLKNILTLLQEAAKINPQALSPVIISFYIYVIHSRFDSIRMNDMLRYLAIKYGSNKRFQLRILYLKIAEGLLDEFEESFYIEHIFNVVSDFTNEKVVFVQSQIMIYLAAFIKKYGYEVYSNKIDKLFNMCEDSTDPRVIELKEETLSLVSPLRRQVSLKSIQKKPFVRTNNMIPSFASMNRIPKSGITKAVGPNRIINHEAKARSKSRRITKSHSATSDLCLINNKV